MTDSRLARPPSAGRAFHLRVFGCQMNVYDAGLIRSAFLRRGYSEVAEPERADAVVFHTCSVREHAEERVHSLLAELRRAKARRPDLVLAVAGCMAEREGRELFRRAPHVDVVCGTRHFPDLPDHVERVLGGEERVLALGEAPRPVDGRAPDLLGRRGSGWPSHSAHVAVMRGCDLHCAFCIVPLVRGPVRSRAPAEILDEVRRLVEDGVTEVSLLGQTVDAYGADLRRGGDGDRGPSLARLLDALAGVPGLLRVKLVTLHPAYVDKELAAAMARSPQFFRFLPMPLQSGSDAVLRRMKRGYTLDQYRRRVDLLRAAMADLELCSDWIVGFPGETEADFAASEAALVALGFLQSFVFQYSPRPGTAAFELRDDVPPAVKAERNRRLLDLQHQAARERTPRMAGTRSRILVEGPAPAAPELLFGRTDNGHGAVLPRRPDLAPGQLVAVELAGYDGKFLRAREVSAPERSQAAAAAGA